MERIFLRTAESPRRNNCGNARRKYSLNPMAEAAIGAENPTMKEVHPPRNPRSGWYILERNAYSPPECGIAAPSIPYESAPHRAMMPPTIHRESNRSGLPRSLISNPLVVKIPAPIMLAITTFVRGKRPSFLSSPALEPFPTVAYCSRFL